MGVDTTGITWLEADVPAPYRLIFSRRGGGVSQAPYDGLNLGFNSGDDPDRVRENRALLSRRLGVDHKHWTLVRQVHSSRVVKVGEGDIGAGSFDHRSGLDDADALVTRETGAVLCVLTADCVPVAMYGIGKPVMALIHSGWKGTMAEIAGTALRALGNLDGVKPEEVGVTLGPGIRRCCYEVDEERAATFRARFGESVIEEKRLDLFKAIRDTLLNGGVREKNILDTGVCTCCDPSFFSFRRSGVTGRQAALLWVVGDEGTAGV